MEPPIDRIRLSQTAKRLTKLKRITKIDQWNIHVAGRSVALGKPTIPHLPIQLTVTWRCLGASLGKMANILLIALKQLL